MCVCIISSWLLFAISHTHAQFYSGCTQLLLELALDTHNDELDDKTSLFVRVLPAISVHFVCKSDLRKRKAMLARSHVCLCLALCAKESQL